jgi:hypothetical protein
MSADAPNMRSVRAGNDWTLIVKWKNGAESTIDVRKYIATYAIFAPLRRNDDTFKKVSLGEWGWSAHWSDDMEIPSDLLWQFALEQGGAWLHTWRKNHEMTQSEAAAALGVSPRMWRYYEAGTHLLPKTVRLACVVYDLQAQAA